MRAMPPQTLAAYREAYEAGALTREQFDTLLDQVGELQRQIEWFKRQLFGAKSERRLVEPDPQQGSLGAGFAEAPPAASNNKVRIPAHDRARAPRPAAAGEDAVPFFDEAQVPVEVIAVPNPEVAQLAPDEYEVIGEKASYRLAQRPAAYVVLKYVRQVIKRRDTQQLVCAPAPAGVIDGSRADVSFIAGLMVDKLVYHLPLYRQHQRLTAAGFRVSRQWLTQLLQTAASLLEPVYAAQLASVLGSRVKAMDETPIKAGLAGPGKMKAAYFWPIYGEFDEICFPYLPDRKWGNVEKLLGAKPPDGAVLLSDGYGAYAEYAAKVGLTHALCWVQYPE
jgi:transposase